MKSKSIPAVLLVALALAACAPGPAPAPISTLILAGQTPTPKPASNNTAASPPATKLERWQEYEDALAAVFLPLPYLPGKGLCEWVFLGRSENEVYVWAECQVADSAGGAAMSAPAVISLAEDDRIENVKVPRDGTLYGADIRQMFPKELQERIFSNSVDVSGMWSHLQLRHENPGPPLIVQSGLPLP